MFVSWWDKIEGLIKDAQSERNQYAGRRVLTEQNVKTVNRFDIDKEE